jgi:membrane protease YdiL (CAAX protease family)
MQLQAASDATAFPSGGQNRDYIALLFSREWQPVADGPTPTDLAYASIMTLVAPVLEETLFTGFLLNAIAKPHGFVAAALGVSLCFTFVHAFKIGVGVFLIPLALAGLTYAVIRIWCGSLLLAVLAHCTINVVIFIPKWVIATIYFSRL